MTRNRLGIIVRHVATDPFINYIAGLSDALAATFFAVDQIDWAFPFAVETSVKGNHSLVTRFVNLVAVCMNLHMTHGPLQGPVPLGIRFGLIKSLFA